MSKTIPTKAELARDLQVAVANKEYCERGLNSQEGSVGDIMWLLGWADWAIEEQIIREEMEKTDEE